MAQFEQVSSVKALLDDVKKNRASILKTPVVDEMPALKSQEVGEDEEEMEEEETIPLEAQHYADGVYRMVSKI